MDRELLKTLDTNLADLAGLIRRSRHGLDALKGVSKLTSSTLATVALPIIQELQATEEETRRLLGQHRDSLKKLAASITDHSPVNTKEE